MAQAAGKFKDEIVAVELCERNKPGLFEKGDHNRPWLASRSCAPPSARTHYHGWQCAGSQHQCRGYDRVRTQVGGEERPNVTRASRILRHRGGRTWHVRLGPGARSPPDVGACGWSVKDVDRVDINEAFAAIAIAVTRVWA